MTDEELNKKCAELDGACAHKWLPYGDKGWTCLYCSRVSCSSSQPSVTDKPYVSQGNVCAYQLVEKLGFSPKHLEISHVGSTIEVTVSSCYFPDGKTVVGRAEIEKDGPKMAVSRATCHAIIMAAEIKKEGPCQELLEACVKADDGCWHEFEWRKFDDCIPSSMELCKHCDVEKGGELAEYPPYLTSLDCAIEFAEEMGVLFSEDDVPILYFVDNAHSMLSNMVEVCYERPMWNTDERPKRVFRESLCDHGGNVVKASATALCKATLAILKENEANPTL